MTNEDAQRAFDDLHRLVAESPLAWVLPNVDDEIQRGKPGTRSLEKTGERQAVYVEASMPPGVRKVGMKSSPPSLRSIRPKGFTF
ncbi:MAG: hypothetical protein PVSMB1_13400 [Gemmatimonadaceae bacterium]